MPKRKKKHGEHYRLSKVPDETSSGYDSVYEGPDGDRYRYDSDLGVGKYAEARLFKSAKSGKAKVVLSPVLDDGQPEEPGGLPCTPETEPSFSSLKEAVLKYTFFKALYPKQPPFLVYQQGTYRIVLPKVAGIPYNKTPLASGLEVQIRQALGLIHALEKAHKKGIVLLDLKEDNILFDMPTGKFYLIDGGLHKPVGERLSHTFICDSTTKPDEQKIKYPQIAPECWALYDKPSVFASYAMDIYSLGYIFSKRFTNPLPIISLIIEQCLLEEPEKRPTLCDLKQSFRSLLVGNESSDEDALSDTDSVVESYPLHRSDWDQYKSVISSCTSWLYGCDSP